MCVSVFLFTPALGHNYKLNTRHNYGLEGVTTEGTLCIPIVSIVVPFFGLTKYIIRIL